MSAAKAKDGADQRRELNAHIDLLEAIGLDQGTDWFLWRRPSTGRVELCLGDAAGAKLYHFITSRPAVVAEALAGRKTTA